jgi:NADPH:quinone reductase
MKAAFYTRTGAAREVLQLGDLPEATPGTGEVKVRLHWSGVNPSDVKSRADLRGRGMPFPRVTPHSDGAGVIEAVGAGVPASRLGRRVWVWNAAWGRADGTTAECVVLPSAQAVDLPEGVSLEAGACFGIPALTALHAVRGYGGVAGQRVLVAGGAGAVGHYAVQFARLLGARQVIASVSSAHKAQVALDAGAHAVVDYRQEPLAARVALEAGAHAAVDYRQESLAARVAELTCGEGLDRVIEVDIAANGALDAEMLKPGGCAVVYGGGKAGFELPFFPLIAKNLSWHFFIVYALSPADRAASEATLRGLLEDGRLQHQIARRVDLHDIVAAHEAVESGQLIGNLVVRLPAAQGG